MKGKPRTSQEIQQDIEMEKEISQLASRAGSFTTLENEKFKALIWEKQRKILKRRDLPVLQRAVRRLISRINTYGQENSPTHQAWVKAYEQAIEEKKQETQNDEKKKRKSVKPPKSKLVDIYNKYTTIYERKRIDYGNRIGTGYGADKQALDDTVKEIKIHEHIDVDPRNLKEALTRRVERKPLKKGKL